MIRKLKAAEPTMVEGPSSPGFYPRVVTVSITLRRISGAEEPRAIRVRFATVGFQTGTLIFKSSPDASSCLKMILFEEVITEIELHTGSVKKGALMTYSMKTSAMMFIPRNIQRSVTRYRMARNGRLRVVMPGSKIQLRQTGLD